MRLLEIEIEYKEKINVGNKVQEKLATVIAQWWS